MVSDPERKEVDINKAKRGKWTTKPTWADGLNDPFIADPSIPRKTTSGGAILITTLPRTGIQAIGHNRPALNRFGTSYSFLLLLCGTPGAGFQSCLGIVSLAYTTCNEGGRPLA